MAVPESIQFKIIFVPGTVRRLAPFVLSLLDASIDCRFCLVSNGCRPEEDRILADLAKTDPRLTFQRVGQGIPLSHGVALSQLQRQEKSPIFAFMDSDIFATGDFVQEFDWSPSQSIARFSCPPVWSSHELEKLPKQFGVLSGTYNRLHDDFCVGSSYFAVYDNDRLTQFVRRTGIDFEYALWTRLPRRIRRQLKQAGKQMLIYDTGKLLNILLQLDTGANLDFRKLTTLEHIGAVSCRVLYQPRGPVRGVLRSVAQAMPRVARQLCWQSGMHYGWRDLLCEEEIRRRGIEQQRQQQVFRHLMPLLRDSKPTTDHVGHFGFDDSSLAAPVSRVSAKLHANYTHWKQRIPRQLSVYTADDSFEADWSLQTSLKAA